MKILTLAVRLRGGGCFCGALVHHIPMLAAPTERSLRLWRGFWQLLYLANFLLILAYW
ncbi:MAG: hypothetical protein AAB728_00090 [Patescibacteria group bacterium]